jgi:putative oxidoreductase
VTDRDIIVLALRVVVGIVFLAHGIKHVVNRDKTIRWTASMGLRYPVIQWFFMAFAEIAIGLSMIAGLLTAIGSAGVVAMMVVAFWVVHRHAGFFVSARPDEGYEYVLVLTVVAFAIAVLGPGRFSLDYAIGLADDLSGRTGAIIAASGFVAAIGQLGLSYRRPRGES